MKPTTTKIVLSLASLKCWHIKQLDVNTSFLNGDIEKEAYITKPEGFEDPIHPHYVCKLPKYLYDLKQVPRAWYFKLSGCVLEVGVQVFQ